VDGLEALGRRRVLALATAGILAAIAAAGIAAARIADPVPAGPPAATAGPAQPVVPPAITAFPPPLAEGPPPDLGIAFTAQVIGWVEPCG
jgi:hypothetical protein